MYIELLFPLFQIKREKVAKLIGPRSSHPEVFLEKGVLKICSRFTGEHPCRSVISIKLLCNFIEIIFRQGCSPVTLLHIFRTSFTKSTSGRRLLGFSVLFTILFYTQNRFSYSAASRFYRVKSQFFC